MKERMTLPDFIGYARTRKPLRLSAKERKKVRATREFIEKELGKKESVPIYGFMTGVGPFLKEKVSQEDPAKVQENILLSHAAGTGEFIKEDEARGMMFLLINMLRKGSSGISEETLECLLSLYNRGIVSAIPSQGSLGASGDLAPQAHLALILIGKGKFFLDGKPAALRSLEYKGKSVVPAALKAGEALALINGTHFMTSILANTVWDAMTLVKSADIIAAMTAHVLNGNEEAFREEIHGMRPHPGQLISALNVRKVLESMGKQDAVSLQDAYSVRCGPQVHGSCRETVDRAKEVVEREINSITGNPIFLGETVLHGGNFHGQILSQHADFLSIALSTLANISERRIERMLNPVFNGGLPPFLASDPSSGDCGLMVVQYTAASLVSENKTLAHPASVDSMPTAGGQEDFVSMGAWACRKARKILDNTYRVLAVELMCTLRAHENGGYAGINPQWESMLKGLHKKMFTGKELDGAIEQAVRVLSSGLLVKKTEKITGKLN